MLSATIQEVSLGQESYFASISWYVIPRNHYNDVIMGTMASQITSPTIVYSTIYSGADQRKPSKLRVTGLCVGNSPGTDEFPAQKASNAENVSIWWRHHGYPTGIITTNCICNISLWKDDKNANTFYVSQINSAWQ